MIANSHKRLTYPSRMPLRRRDSARQEGGVSDGWQAWLRARFPSYTTYPPAPHHVQTWDWAWAITRGVRPPPFILILARGGAKSTTAELGTVGVAARKRGATGCM
jgi:hypothetical protein